jgi:hypothetical protein
VNHIEFATANPAVSARCHWLTIQSQIEMLKISSVDLHRDIAKRTITGTTANVARLALRITGMAAGATITVELDGQKLENIASPAENGEIVLVREGDKWTAISEPASSKLKNPQRYGPFKDAFRNSMIFIYGTAGTPEENAWSLRKRASMLRHFGIAAMVRSM